MSTTYRQTVHLEIRISCQMQLRHFNILNMNGYYRFLMNFRRYTEIVLFSPFFFKHITLSQPPTNNHYSSHRKFPIYNKNPEMRHKSQRIGEE